MPITFVVCPAAGGMSSYDVMMTIGGMLVKVAHIRYDKWTSTWALLHATGLIEMFDSMTGAQAGAVASYG